jgi:hypothetical protein
MMSSLYILALCPFIRGMISELEFLGRKKTLALKKHFTLIIIKNA